MCVWAALATVPCGPPPRPPPSLEGRTSCVQAPVMRKVNGPFAQYARPVADTFHTGSHTQIPMNPSMQGATAPVSPTLHLRTGWSLNGPPGEPEHPQQDPPPQRPNDPIDPGRPQQPEVPPIEPHSPTVPEPRMRG